MVSPNSAPGMTRNQVADFIGDSPSRSESGREDEWRIDRPIGGWNLFVSYNEDGTFSDAHLRYSSPIFGKHDRARNYTQHDAPYEIRAQH